MHAHAFLKLPIQLLKKKCIPIIILKNNINSLKINDSKLVADVLCENIIILYLLEE